MSELPDWLRGVVLLATTAGGDYVPVLVDAAGQINVLVRGADAGGTVRTVRVDNSGQLYAILRGASGVDVAVDASGFITAVLKGSYAGALHTIGVDAEGRLEAFILDAEDQWGQTLRLGTGNLASRLGALQSWDWRGDVLRQTDFSLGLGDVVPAASGAGGATALDPVYWASGGYSLKLTAGSDGGKYARAQLCVGASPAARIGLAVRFSLGSGVSYARLFLERMIGAWSSYAFARLDVANQVVQILKTDLTWQTLGSVKVYASLSTFLWMKLVIDVDNDYYLRVLFNDVEYDASQYQYPTITSPLSGAILAEFENDGPGATNPISYLDALVITVNEPPNA